MLTYWDAFLDDLKHLRIADADAPLHLEDVTPRKLLEEFWRWYDGRRQQEAKTRVPQQGER